MLNFITGSVPKVGVESNSTIDIFFSMILNFPNEEQISFAFLSKSIFNFFSELELCLLSTIHFFAIIEMDSTPAFGTETVIKLRINGIIDCKEF